MTECSLTTIQNKEINNGYRKRLCKCNRDGDNLGETHFNNALASKVGDALEKKRQDVAKTFVKHHVPEVEEDSE